MREFQGNPAHSNFDSFLMDRGPRPDGHFATGGHNSVANPADANSPQVESVIEDYTAYKNRNGGLWTRGEMHTYKNLRLADNAIGYTHATALSGRSAFTSRVVDSLFVGETENIGNPKTPSEMAYGRSLPFPDLPDFPIRAYEFYDFRHELDNVTFVNYQDNATRKTGAISYLLYTSFGISSNNTVQREIRQRRSQCISRRWRKSGATMSITAMRPGRPRCSTTRTAPVTGVPRFPISSSSTAESPIDEALRGEAHVERCRVQGRRRAHEYRRGRWWRSMAQLLVLAVVAVEARVVVAWPATEALTLHLPSRRSFSSRNGKDFPVSVSNQRTSGCALSSR